MQKVLIFGNSGSGKSTLARKLSAENALSHLDLDTIAWKPSKPPERNSLDVSREAVDAFININNNWVIEGGYADLLDMVMPLCNRVIFMNLSIDDCITNAKSRPWEPHKYSSKKEQDDNLTMLINWISQYNQRNDTFSAYAHQKLYDQFDGEKSMYTCNN